MIHNLGKRDYRAVLRALRAPALWPLQLLAAEIGFIRALECCESREIPEEAVPAFDACGYLPRDLPLREDVEALVRGVRITRRWNPSKEPLQRVARKLGLTLKQAHHALNVYAHYGANTQPLRVMSETALKCDALRSRPPN